MLAVTRRSLFHRIHPLTGFGPILSRRLPLLFQDVAELANQQQQPPTRVTNNDKALRFEIEVPRFKQSEINVTVKPATSEHKNALLHIQGEAKTATAASKAVQEDIVADTFSTNLKLDSSFRLPEGLELPQIETVVEDGVLRILIPYSKAAVEERKAKELFENWPPRFTHDTATEGIETYTFAMPGMKKEYLNVQLNEAGTLVVEAAVGKKKASFTLQVPKNSTHDNFHASFKDEKLSITVQQPKKPSATPIKIL